MGGEGEACTVRMGIVVDAVSEALPIRAEDIEPTPSLGSKLDNDDILGMANMDRGVKILLHIDRVLTVQDAALFGQAA